MLTFSELIQDVYDALGHQITKGLIATGGSTTTIIDTTLSDDYQDDHFVNYQAFIHRDAGGGGAAPENEFQKVSAFNATTKTLTTSAFTTAVAVGDEVLLVKPNPFPLADVKRLCNTALRLLGKIRRYDTSLTTVDNCTEYTLPDTIRIKPNAVSIQSITTDTNNNLYIPVSNFRVEEGIEGADWTLIIPQYPSGRKIKIEFNDVHAMLSSYNDPVSEIIPSPLAVAVCAWYCAKWHAANDETWAQNASELRQMYEVERMRNPMFIKIGKSQGMPHWNTNTQEFVPPIIPLP